VRKIEEIMNPKSCLNKAAEDELIFVLRANDPAMADTIRSWVTIRVQRKLNKLTDVRIVEAIKLANLVDEDEKEREQAP
jgi:hypothetical protein